MNDEFKKLSQGDVTRYVLENASGGGTSSGSVASVSMPMGGMQRRKGDNLIAQESDKKKVPASTPRNFVAKNAKSSGAGAHKDKKKEAKQGNIKHKKPFMENFNGEYDDEAGMAQSNLITTARAVMGLLKTIKDRDNLPEWGQEKIAKAEMMLVSVWDYLQSQKAMGNDPQQGVEEGGAGLSKDAETNFHAKLDQLVHATFGKRKSEQGMEEDDSALNAFLSKGGKVQQLPYKKPRKADKTDYGSKHIGGGGDKMKASRTGTAAKTQGSKVVGVAEAGSPAQQAAIAIAKKKEQGVEEVKQRLDPKCWTGKHKEGTKIKGGVRVNNCVPNESVDTYFESLQQMVERQLEPTMDLDAWVDNFQNADPQKYHQFKNKTPEKKK
jgi:hypothetical protein